MFTPNERSALANLLKTGLIDSFRHFHRQPGHYSWWPYYRQARPRNLGWRIDYFLIDQRLLPYLQDGFILSKVMGSDHCPVGIKIKNFPKS